MVIMDALDQEHKIFDKNSLPAGTRENIKAGFFFFFFFDFIYIPGHVTKTKTGWP